MGEGTPAFVRRGAGGWRAKTKPSPFFPERGPVLLKCCFRRQKWSEVLPERLCDNMVQPFGSEEHQQGEKQKIEGIQPDGNVGGDQSEKGRHESGAYISAGHLNPDDSLGILLAEVEGGGMDDGGIDGGASQPMMMSPASAGKSSPKGRKMRMAPNPAVRIPIRMRKGKIPRRSAKKPQANLPAVMPR